MARADMESADSAAPIVASGKRAAAGRVIGVRGCGDDPVCHDGRSISEQGSGWEGLFGRVSLGWQREGGAFELLVGARGWFAVTLALAQRGVADPRELVG